MNFKDKLCHWVKLPFFGAAYAFFWLWCMLIDHEAAVWANPKRSNKARRFQQLGLLTCLVTIFTGVVSWLLWVHMREKDLAILLSAFSTILFCSALLWAHYTSDPD